MEGLLPQQEFPTTTDKIVALPQSHTRVKLECSCGWEFGPCKIKDAAKQAMRHTQKTGHDFERFK